MPIQINELVIRAEIADNTINRQNVTPGDDSAKIQKIIDEFSKIIKNKNER
jgi:hypothetical protein